MVKLAVIIKVTRWHKFCSGIDTKGLSGYNIKQLGRRNYLFGFTAAASSLGGHLFFSGSNPL
jgi:hypothetical protein